MLEHRASSLSASLDGSDKPSSPTPQMRLSDVLKRKKPPKRGAGRKGGSRGSEDSPDFTNSKSSSSLGGNHTPATRGKLMAAKDNKSPGGKSSFLANLNPSRWGRSSSSAPYVL